jgi:arylsulfatase A-like enzyme
MNTRKNRSPWPLAVLALAAVGAYAYWTVELAPDAVLARPKGGIAELEALASREDTNVLFILIDTLRAERMSAYGYSRETTPFLSKLSSTGIRFGRNISQSSWTKASMASMWSSQTPLRVGITRFDETISDQVEMPAEILAKAGFKTVGLYRNGWVNPSFNFQQGFEKYYKPLSGRINPQIQRMRPNAGAHGNDESVVLDAKEFLRIHGESSRWFLYLHFMDVHEYTYDQESALFGNGVSDIYDNSVLREDWVVSTLYDYLAERGFLDDTIVVVLSDHGEAFGERGYEGHAREVFPETTETPVIVSLPFALERELVLPMQTSNMDVWPTLLELMGLPLPSGEIDGHSRFEEILAIARGEAPPAREESTITYLDENWGTPGGKRMPAVSIVDGDHRYVAGTGLNGQKFEVLLSSEDGMRTNQLAAKPELAEQMRAKALEAMGETSAYQTETIELDQMQLDQLRALGYQLP